MGRAAAATVADVSAAAAAGFGNSVIFSTAAGALL